MVQKVSLLQRVATYDRRWIYVLLFILVLAPMLSPIGMPIAVSDLTKGFYDKLTTLKPGDIVLDAWSTEYSGYMELKPGMIATHKLLIRMGVKFFVCFGHAEDPAIESQLFDVELKSYLDSYDYQYGRDYVILGFVFPNAPAVVAAVTDFQGTVKVDWSGNSIEGTFLDGVHTGADINMIIDFSTGCALTGWLVQHVVLRFGTPMIQNAIGVMMPGTLSYLDAGLYKAALASSRGGAELEYLISEPGPGLIMMDAYTLAHYMTIVFIVLGNIGYFGWTRRQRKEETTTRG